MKNLSTRVLVIFYVGALVLALIITIKPGATFFYLKSTIEPQSLVKDSGFSYRYLLPFDRRLFRIQDIMLFENGKLLAKGEWDTVTNKGLGSFEITTTSKGLSYLYFAASDNSNPSTNGKTYTLYAPWIFITRLTGIYFLLLLLPIAAWFFTSKPFRAELQAVTNPEIQQTQAGDGVILRIRQATQAYLHQIWKDIKIEATFWQRLFTTSILAVFLYIFMEWLFFVTMPSFMSMLKFTSKIEILIISAWGFSLSCIVTLAAFVLIDCLIIAFRVTGLARFWGIIIPTIILSSLALLLVDNFTYTIFKFGISTSTGIARGIYGIVFILITGYIYYRQIGFFGLKPTAGRGPRRAGRWFAAALALFAISTVLAMTNMNFNSVLAASATANSVQVSKLPNIVLLGSDGLNASNMSVYGYYRETTPRLEELAKSSLVAENAFTNAGNTAGSVISIMTSKLPTQTRVLYPPDILRGIDAFQHLPGILKNIGYQNSEIGVPYYIDADNFNLQNGFDLVNNRQSNSGGLNTLGRKLGFENEAYFLTRLSGRITDRLLHIFFVREMQNPYDIVTHPAAETTDQTKINQALSLFDKYQEPLFIHIHLLGTHGGYYAPRIREFSAMERQTEPWMTDFYDDTLIGFDTYVGQFIDALKAKGVYDNTILIIYTDHNKEFKSDERIPLMIHFPGGAHAGEIIRNVENMDISPTLLDYLGISKPAWMEGVSLLSGESAGKRLIFSAGTSETKPNEIGVNNVDPDQDKPPFYQFTFVSVEDCQKIYSLNLNTFEWTITDVAEYVNPCNPQELLSMDQVKQAVYQRLEKDGFDISSLP